MRSVRLELSIICASCGERVGVNALVPKVLCRQCETVVEVPLDRWESLHRNLVQDVVESESPISSLSVGLGSHQLEAKFRIEEPGFPGSEQQAPRRRLDEPLASRMPSITCAFGEDESMLCEATEGYTSFRLPASETPQQFACTQCGADLTVDGTSRQIRCTYCQGTCVIPNELWSELHPVRVRPFWVIVGGDLRTRATKGSASEAVIADAVERPSGDSTWMAVGIEGSSSCGKCQSTLPINAMAPRITCLQCGTVTKISTGLWTDLGQQIAEWITSDRNRGTLRSISSSGSMTGRRKGVFDFDFFREAPRFGDDRTIEAREATRALATSVLTDPGTGETLKVRPVPDRYAEAWSEVACLVGEAEEQLADEAGHLPLFPAEKPVAYTCPSCGGALELDGRQRRVICHYCSEPFDIPATVWHKLHPPLRKRWYAWLEVSARPLSWRGDARDAVCDEKGALYILAEDGGPMLASVDATGMPRWVRRDLADRFDFGDCAAKLAVTRDRLVVWARETEQIAIFDTTTGKLVRELDFAGCRALTGDLDGTLLGWFESPSSTDRTTYRLERRDLEGRNLPVWSGRAGVARKIGGLFRKVSGMLPTIDKLGNRPELVASHDIRVRVAWDGSILVFCYGHLYRYDRGGDLIQHADVEGAHDDACVGDAEGNVVTLSSDSDNGSRLERISSDGHQKTVLARHVKLGGTMQYEDVVAIRPDGTLFLLHNGGKMRMLSPEGELMWASRIAAESDERERNRG